MPGDAPGIFERPESETGAVRFSLILVKAAFNQFLELLESPLCVCALRCKHEARALAGRKHHKAHDALSVYLLAILLDPDLGPMLVRNAHEHGCGSRVQAKLVQDGHFFLDFSGSRSPTQ
jgi:hypothetical protein